MAVDKLVDSTQLDSDLTSVANAIRSKGGTSAQMAFPTGFVSAVQAIPTGGDSIIRQIVSLGENSLRGASIGEIGFFESLKTAGMHCLAYLPQTEILVFPALTATQNYPFTDNVLLQKLDIGETLPSGSFSTYFFAGNRVLTEIILRMPVIRSLPSLNCFQETPFASDGSGGTLYVPGSLISSYQTASNWATILGYAHNSIVAIEGSPYENYYADGTPIS